MDKIKMLVIPSDRMGCGKFRSVDPHVYIAEHYPDEFDIDIVYDIPKENTAEFFGKYDLIHIHKQLDPQLQLMNMIKFLGIPVIVDVDDNYKLGTFHPMSITATKEKWHVPIINHLRAADYASTTTPIYAKEISKHNKNVLVFPNAINPEEEQYKDQVKKPSDKLRVGIICGSSHLHDISLLKGVCNQVPLDKVQFVLCGFDTNGVRTIYHNDTGQVERRPILPEESVWYDYEKIITDNYKYLSPQHKDFLLKFMKGVDDPFENEMYRRQWTRDINKYATHYENVDVLLAPLKDCDFNKMKSQLKEIEAGFTNTAIIAQNFGAYTIDLVPILDKSGKIVENGNCLLVDTTKNHKMWGKYITKLANDPELVALMKKNLHDYVTKTYSLEKVCADRVAAYKKIVEEAKKR